MPVAGCVDEWRSGSGHFGSGHLASKGSGG
jgi:hypothetical protein